MKQHLVQSNKINKLELLHNHLTRYSNYRPGMLKIPQPKFQPNILGNMNTGAYRGVETFDSQFGDAGLAAYYKFDEASGNIINQSLDASKIASADLVTSGVTYGVTGILDDAISYDGVNDVADASSSAVADWGFLNKSGESWTICTWYKFLTHRFQRFMATANFSAGDAGILFGENADRTFTLTFGENAVDQITYTTTKVTPNDANYHFMYISYDDATGDLIFNIDAGTREVSGSHNLTNTSNPETYLNIADNSVSQDFSHMVTDEMSIWNGRVLSEAEEDALAAVLPIY